MAQASLAPCRQADIFHNRKHCHAPLSFSISSPMPPGGEADGHKAWAIPCITCRTCSCSCESSGRRSPADPGISSAGRPVSIPADITLLAGFFAELFQRFVQALTKNAASKPLILLHGVRKLGSDIFQFHAQLSCLTLVSTRSLAFSCRLARCASPGAASGLTLESSAISIIRFACMSHTIWYLSFFAMETSVTRGGLLGLLQPGNRGP